MSLYVLLGGKYVFHQLSQHVQIQWAGRLRTGFMQWQHQVSRFTSFTVTSGPIWCSNPGCGAGEASPSSMLSKSSPSSCRNPCCGASVPRFPCMWHQEVPTYPKVFSKNLPPPPHVPSVSIPQAAELRESPWSFLLRLPLMLVYDKLQWEKQLQ